MSTSSIQVDLQSEPRMILWMQSACIQQCRSFLWCACIVGASLRGPFSRYDFQRNPNSGPSSVKGYTTLLPAAAQDVYYRDEIGNISTSNLREEEDYVSLELRPRYKVSMKFINLVLS